MKKMKPILISLCLIAVTACRGTPAATPDIQGTVDAAVAATNQAEVALQATIDAAVRATTEAISTPAPGADPSTKTEEELATDVERAVGDAANATQASSTAVTAAAADGTVTQEELDSIEAYLLDAEEAIAYAEELVYLYYDLYGELASETLLLLDAIEGDLSLLADEVVALTEALLEIETALTQGLQLAEETLTQFETAAAAAADNASDVQTQVQAWRQSLLYEIQTRAANVLSVGANSVAESRVGAVRSAFEYVDAVRQALLDERISASELANIAQLGANASVSLNTHGGPQLQPLSGTIDSITTQLASGQAFQAQTALDSLESALGTRPSR